MAERLQAVEINQSDEKGAITEMVGEMKSDNKQIQEDLSITNEEMIAKTEKINWFERKLNKWVKLFETAEQDGALRHNDLVKKLNEVDDTYRKETKSLTITDGRIWKRIEKIERAASVTISPTGPEDTEPTPKATGTNR